MDAKIVMDVTEDLPRSFEAAMELYHDENAASLASALYGHSKGSSTVNALVIKDAALVIGSKKSIRTTFTQYGKSYLQVTNSGVPVSVAISSGRTRGVREVMKSALRSVKSTSNHVRYHEPSTPPPVTPSTDPFGPVYNLSDDNMSSSAAAADMRIITREAKTVVYDVKEVMKADTIWFCIRGRTNADVDLFGSQTLISGENILHALQHLKII